MAVAVLLGAVAGWAVGRVHDDCEQACGANGVCPTPASCLVHQFNWAAAVALGAVVALAVLGLGLLLLRRSD